MISRNHQKRSAKIQKLKDEISSSQHTIPLLDVLQTLEDISIEETNIFHILKEISISYRDDQIRYVATKLLYKNFLEESIDFIAKLLLNDSNYNFQIINLSNQKRYNFNDIINWGIEARHNKELMIKNIINSDLLWFALSWRDYRDEFDIRYDVNLNCFLLTAKATNEAVYICRRINDPFQEISILSIENLSEVAQSNAVQIIVRLFEELLTIKKHELKIARLSPEKSSGLPNWKVFSYFCELVIYLESNF